MVKFRSKGRAITKTGEEIADICMHDGDKIKFYIFMRCFYLTFSN